MAGKSPAKAFDSFFEPIQRAVSCITRTILTHDCHDRRAGRDYVLGLSDDGRCSVAAGGERIEVTIQQRFRILEADGVLGPWRVQVVEYNYVVEAADGHEVLAYHWHPSEGFRRPHFHLGPGSGERRPPLDRAHLPTSRVAIEDFLLLLIRDFKVPPMRKDHEAVLHASRARSEQDQVW